MASWEILGAFFLAALLFAYMPGPALIYTAAQTMARGRRAGFMAALGLHLGGYVHVAAATLGLSALFQFVPPLYTALKIAGALYLVWLGISILRRRGEPAAPHVAARSARRAFVESMTVEVLNPKTVLFYVAFLPQFVDPAGAWAVSLQFLVLGVIVNAMFASADVAAVLLTDRLLASVGRASWRERAARAVGGSILIALGARLAFLRD
jgi:threonine/homoserine/homoserine lactone efflux protein